MNRSVIASWSRERDLWEAPQLDIFGDADVFSTSLPKSGCVHGGEMFERPTLVEPAANGEVGERVLPTPVAQPSGNSPQEHLRKKPGRKVVTDLSIIVENGLLETGGELPSEDEEAAIVKERLFPTPKASDGVMGRPKTTGRPIEQSTHLCTIATLLPTVTTRDHTTETGEENRHTPALRAVSVYFPTPNTMDSLSAREGEALERQLHRGDLNGSRRSSTGNLREDIIELAPKHLPTPNARDGAGGGAQHPDFRLAGGHQACLTDAATIMGEGSESAESPFGRYAAAVERWEDATRPAPAPTELNTRNKPRLAAPFAEWMMGLPEGWVTSEEIGLTRAQQLKAIGNGVVPQQAATAISFLLGRAIEDAEAQLSAD